MKFRFLVSGSAVSPDRVEAIRRSIEDVGLAYHLGETMLVEVIPPGQTLRVIVDESVPLPTALRCGHCGALLTAEQAWTHLCPKPSKSARRPLTAPAGNRRPGPLYLVVLIWLDGILLRVIDKLEKRKAS